MRAVRSAIIFTFTLLFPVVCIPGQDAGIRDVLGRETLPVVTSGISSTAAGGVWSSPSTWIGGIVPAAGDEVTIAGGATVIIDTGAAANSITVGGTGSISGAKSIFAEGALPAALRFGETGAFSLTVTGNVTIGSNDSFTTGGGNANQHVLAVGGNLTNNGTLDFSTNNNQAGAMIVFTGASNNTFGGSGPVTDISWITMEKGASSANILELSAANFSVRGSTADTPDAGFLFLNHGTFKISGTFALSNRTFYTTPYDIAAGAGLWLNNPNYTIVAQHQDAVAVFGLLRVTQGTYNIGTQLNDSLLYYAGSTLVMEGGAINTAGRVALASDGSLDTSYTQSGGAITTCTVGTTVVSSPPSGCFDTGFYVERSTFAITAGDIVVQNAATGCCAWSFIYRSYSPIRGSGATVRLGNASTSRPDTFRVLGALPNMVIDTTAGGHTVRSGSTEVGNVEIGPGGTLDILDTTFNVYGETFINNGAINGKTRETNLVFLAPDQTYSGSGVVEGPVWKLTLKCNSLTLDPVNNLRVREISFDTCVVKNSNKMTIGGNDSYPSYIYYEDSSTTPGGLDAPPVFEPGTGLQNLIFRSRFPRTTGYEINPGRHIDVLAIGNSGTPGAPDVTLEGGDLTVAYLYLISGVFRTGSNKIIHDGQRYQQAGYVDGTLVRKISSREIYDFYVGHNGYSPIHMDVTDLAVSPTYLSVTPVAQTLPGLLPSTSISRYWKLEETGDLRATLYFTYAQEDVRGSETDYKLWYSSGGLPVRVSAIVNEVGNTLYGPSNVDVLTGNWGGGAQLDPGPVSISGTVTAAGGQPIRNATLTISGGNLPSPAIVQTGNFGTYGFNNLQAGEAYTVRVDVKRYRFAQPTRIVTPMGNVSNVNFVANPQE